eukprot:gnl/Dysnectes_brevis/3025_a3737_1357.p1 GENE.gnl/Dysnectes_brevis/3025_a3737_1357~~gnl/Dysnectes_brevis/3025_a3737_1357.p1  ORF type:complete len:475 (-),score=89.22 gnl/Dysnectes_brevis/3025_a3737_1357:85-1509(-)
MVKMVTGKRSFSLRSLVAWAMIDFSNSLALVVVLALYAAFIPTYVFPTKEAGTHALKVNSIATGVFSIVSTPLLGAIIDRCGYKLWTLAGSGIIYSIATIFLTWVQYGDTTYTIVLYMLVDITFRINESVCSSFMPLISKQKDFGLVSGCGYFIGYLAGYVVIQIINRLTPTSASGPDSPDWDQVFVERGSAMLIAGVFMLLSLLPALLTLKDDREERKRETPRITGAVVKQAFQSNVDTFKRAFTDNRNLTMVLVSYLLFMMGMYCQRSYNAFLHLRWAKADYGVTLQLVQTVMGVINIVVGCSSLLYGFISRYVGVKPMILVSIFFVALCSVISIYWEPLGEALGVNPGTFWVWAAGMAAALGIGPAQSLLRAAVGTLLPKDKNCEIFGVMESLNTLGDIFGNVAPERWVNTNYRYVYALSLPFLLLSFIGVCLTPIKKFGREEDEGELSTPEQDVVVESCLEGQELVSQRV